MQSWTLEHFEFTRFICARNSCHSRVKFTTCKFVSWEGLLQSRCKMADMDFVERVAALYVLWKAEKWRGLVRRRVWVHKILQKRTQLGEFHQLLQELCLDDGRFQRYFRLSRSQFDDLLSHVVGRISLQDTNYRRSIPPAEHLSICLRSVNN